MLVAIFLALVSVVMGTVVQRGWRRLAQLDLIKPDRSVLSAADLPSVSIVIPARNEERHLAQALQSVIAMANATRTEFGDGKAGPLVEIVVINDRSTDRTAAILNQLALQHPIVKILTIATLPKGWLGKNWALHSGSEIVIGARAAAPASELLLFTDADVVFEPDALIKALTFFSTGRVDHLAVLARIGSRSALANGFIGFFGFNFLGYFQPWRARDSKSKAFIGIGAFNLVRRTTYRAIGGHQRIAMRPDDDIKLGKLIKNAGYRQECLVAKTSVSVEWYASLAECWHGLQKNVFAGVDYSIVRITLSSAFLILAFVSPFVLANLFAYRNQPLASLICAIAWLVTTSNLFRLGLKTGNRTFEVLLQAAAHPFYAAFMAAVLIRSTIITLLDGGIWWRDTFYSLRELRTNDKSIRLS